MAEDFLSLDAGEQGDILRTVAVRSGRRHRPRRDFMDNAWEYNGGRSETLGRHRRGDPNGRRGGGADADASDRCRLRRTFAEQLGRVNIADGLADGQSESSS